MTRIDDESRKSEIRDLIDAFLAEHLNDEYAAYCRRLLERIASSRMLSISRGRPEIWAAAIIWVIARLNFLFDPADENFIKSDTISDFFGTKKSTVGNKATAIEKACQIGFGDPDFCRKEITDALTFAKSPDGFIIPKTTLEDMEIVIEVADAQETEAINRALKARELLGKEASLKKKRKRDDHKQAERNKNQFGLFDNNVESAASVSAVAPEGGESVENIYTLTIKCVDGAYLAEDYSWVVEVLSNMSLERLHRHILDQTLFDDDHLASFFTARDMYGKKTWLIDPDTDRGWTRPLADIYPLENNQRLFYFFDFGDSWVFSIGKRAKSKPVKQGEYYPNVIKITGNPPEQYPDFDSED